MNWRMSSAELARLHEQSPWLYMIEWRERLDRCVMALNGGRVGLDPDVACIEAASLRSTAEWLIAIADKMDKGARDAQRIAALRLTTGRTPEEAALYAEKADALEGALKAN